MSTIRLNIMEQGRATEWLCSLVLLFFAICLAVPGNTLTSSSGFRAFLAMGLDEASIATPMAMIAALRLSALHINGNWRKSPHLRMAGAVFGSAIFSTLAMAFLWPTLAYGAALSSGVWRVDGPIDVLDGKKLHLNQGANLKRFAEHSDSTDPVLRVLGVGSEAHGGQVETENAHPDGVLAAGHKDLVELRNAWWWKVTSMTLLGVKAAGNRGIKVVNADNSDAPIFANYFGSMSNIQVRGSDVGLELLEVANAHQFFDIQFWDLMTAAYRLRGAFENMFVGGFVHACDPGITCIQLLNRTTGPHDTVGNQFLGIGMEPATGTANEFICSIESNCSQNTIQAFGNCAGGFGTIANTNNYINASYGEFYTDASRAIITGSHRIDGAGYQRRGPNISKSKKGQLAENATTEVLEIEVGFGTSCVIASVDITMANSALGHTAVVSKKYALRRDADGVIQVSELSGDRAGTQAAYDFDWRINDDYRAFGRISTFNNGTGTLTDYSLEVTLTTLDENVPVDKLKII